MPMLKVGQLYVTKNGINRYVKQTKNAIRGSLVGIAYNTAGAGALFASGCPKMGTAAVCLTLLNGLGAAFCKFTKDVATKNMVSTRGVTYNDIVKRAKQIYSK